MNSGSIDNLSVAIQVNRIFFVWLGTCFANQLAQQSIQLANEQKQTTNQINNQLFQSQKKHKNKKAIEIMHMTPPRYMHVH